MEWMAWTLPVAIFFGVIACILVAMTVNEIRNPAVERKGFLPISTTPGDRLFIGLLSSAYLHLAVIGLSELSLWYPFVVSVIWLVFLLRRG
jgi:predicted small integral membrane protein